MRKYKWISFYLLAGVFAAGAAAQEPVQDSAQVQVRIQAPAPQPAAPAGNLFRVQTGFGPGFGGLIGGGLEVENNNIAGFLNIGYWEEVILDIGARYYFKAPGSKIRPHVALSIAPTHQITYGAIYYDPGTDEFVSEKDHSALIYGVNMLGGFDHDFGKPGGFLMSYAVGIGFPMYTPEKVEDFYEDMGFPTPEADPAFTLNIGIKYEF